MFGKFQDHTSAPARAGFRIIGRITLPTLGFVQVQYATEECVLIEVDRLLVLSYPSRNERFTVDRSRRLLRRMDMSRSDAQIQELRSALGEARVCVDPQESVVEGYACRRIRVHSESDRAVVDAEIFCARVPGIDRTCLHQERLLDMPLPSPASLMQADEIVVRSKTRILCASFEQQQAYELVSVEAGPAAAEALSAIVTYPTN